jgi:tight adherence protein B
MNVDQVTITLIIVLAASSIGVLFIIFFLLSPDATQSRLHDYATVAPEESLGRPEDQHSSLNRLRRRLKKALALFSSKELQLKISSAYWPIFDTEFILIRFAAAGLGFIIGWLISGNILGGLGLGLVLYIVPGLILSRSILLRQKLFQEQLIDVLMLIKGAVQSGYSLLQSLDVVIDEMAAPSSEEFGRVVNEIQYGISLKEALTNLSDRMKSDDLQLVVTSVIINTEVGGNLSTMLDAVTNTIRDRIYLFGEVRAATSYATYTGNFLSLLPFITVLVIYLVNPDYFEGVMEPGITQIIFIFAGFLILFGNIWMRRIVKIDV